MCGFRPAYGVLFCWFTGFLSGTLFTVSRRSSFLPLMCSAVIQPVSIVGLFICAFFPLLFLAYASAYQKQWLIYFVCFYKSFSHFSVASVIYLRYLSAAWLVYIIIMFSDIFTLMLVFALSINFDANRLRHTEKLLFYGAIILVPICGIDYFWVSPLILDIFYF